MRHLLVIGLLALHGYHMWRRSHREKERTRFASYRQVRKAHRRILDRHASMFKVLSKK